VGPNGAGKTTVFNLITGVLPPDSGEIFLSGKRITGWPPHKLAAHGIGRTFQNIRLFKHLNALENVMIGRTARTRAGVLSALVATSAEAAERRATIEHAETLLDWVGVGVNRFRMPAELPYGDQRRVEIARALALEPRLLILDEPTRGIDVGAKTEVQRLVLSLCDDGVSVLFVSAELEEVLRLSDRVAVLRDRHVVAEIENDADATLDRLVDTIAGGEAA
jgi:branched-chain amino acid transport system ATP-binding protein